MSMGSRSTNKTSKWEVILNNTRSSLTNGFIVMETEMLMSMKRWKFMIRFLTTKFSNKQHGVCLKL